MSESKPQGRCGPREPECQRTNQTHPGGATKKIVGIDPCKRAWAASDRKARKRAEKGEAGRERRESGEGRERRVQRKYIYTTELARAKCNGLSGEEERGSDTKTPAEQDRAEGPTQSRETDQPDRAEEGERDNRQAGRGNRREGRPAKAQQTDNAHAQREEGLYTCENGMSQYF